MTLWSNVSSSRNWLRWYELLGNNEHRRNLARVEQLRIDRWTWSGFNFLSSFFYSPTRPNQPSFAFLLDDSGPRAAAAVAEEDTKAKRKASGRIYPFTWLWAPSPPHSTPTYPWVKTKNVRRAREEKRGGIGDLAGDNRRPRFDLTWFRSSFPSSKLLVSSILSLHVPQVSFSNSLGNKKKIFLVVIVT